MQQHSTKATYGGVYFVSIREFASEGVTRERFHDPYLVRAWMYSCE